MENISCAKPFLKWAGGKKQLLIEFNKRLPNYLKENGSISRYVEPFVGGGAMFFYLKKHYIIKESIILDINRELVIAYKVIKNDHKSLVSILLDIEEDHLNMDEDGRKENYYKIRDVYNQELPGFDFSNYN